MKLSVPYYSQFLEVKDYYWNIRSCSGASTAMVLEYFTGKKIDILEFMNNSKKEGGYGVLNGMTHDYLISFFEKQGLKSWRYKNLLTKDTLSTIDPLVEQLRKGNPVIVSVNKFILEQKKFHTLVLIGFEENESEEVTHFYYHEPEATVVSMENDPAVGGANRCVDIATFNICWRGRAIFVSK